MTEDELYDELVRRLGIDGDVEEAGGGLVVRRLDDRVFAPPLRIAVDRESLAACIAAIGDDAREVFPERPAPIAAMQLIFSNAAGRPVTPTNYGPVWVRARNQLWPAGHPLASATVYDLRHGAATMMLRAAVHPPRSPGGSATPSAC